MTKPSNGGYFYLHDSVRLNPTGYVKIKSIVSDVERGVKRLSEDAYCPSHGVTQTSLRFMTALVGLFGIEPLRAKTAELRYSKKHHFTLVVETVLGFTIVFKGVSGGYYGEGSRGCYDLLKAFGYSDKQCEQVFHKETFRLQRSLSKTAH